MNWKGLINILVQLAVFFIDKQHKKDAQKAANLDKIDEEIIKTQNERDKHVFNE